MRLIDLFIIYCLNTYSINVLCITRLNVLPDDKRKYYKVAYYIKDAK